MKATLYSILTYCEILTRLLKSTGPLEGPSCYPVIIRYEASNTTAPPVISVGVYETQCDGSDETVFFAEFDQNTSYTCFEGALIDLQTAVKTCVEAINGGRSYKEQRRLQDEQVRKAQKEIDDLPF